MRPSDRVDLTNCDREPIHIPGAIQPHGCVLVCDVDGDLIVRHSANAAAMLDRESALDGARLEAVVGDGVVHQIRNALASAQGLGRQALLFGQEIGGIAFDVAVHRYAGAVVLELEFAGAASMQPLDTARQLVRRLAEIDDADRMIEEATRLLRAFLGYDRVMIYRFEDDGAGKVVAESRGAGLERFLGRYFPASDIPQQARTLYRRNPIRVIPDVGAAPVPLLPAEIEAQTPVDLSFAHLRGVSPIHLEYLGNMGVAASMSISVIPIDALWGLVACHHYAPKVLSMGERVAAEMFGAFFSLHLHALAQQRRLETAMRARASLERLLRLATQRQDVGALIAEHLEDLSRLVPCDGVGLWLGDEWTAAGSTPPVSAIPALARHVGRVSEGRVHAIHALAAALPEAEDYAAGAAGVLAVPLSVTPRDYLFFFRKELVRTLEWAGNPEKSYETGPLGDRLTPRKSFAIWRETVRMQSQRWSELERETGEAARSMLAEVVLRHNELMAEERQKADVRQRMLNEELNHRVKNILSIIKSVVSRPVDDGRSLADYAGALEGRIGALAVAHDQVVRGDGGGLISTLLEAELLPYGGGTDRVALAGPPLWVDARAFSVLALVLHELSTNAAKYGALSVPSGRLVVEWHLDEHGDCRLLWRERGGPRVAPPKRAGFGSALIERSVAYDLGGASSVAFPPEGVEARLALPARHLAQPLAEAPPLRPRRGGGPPAAEPGLASGTRVLLVEDQLLIAMDAESLLASVGITAVVTAGSTAEAMQRLAEATPDVAVLDVNLGDGTSIPVAEELHRRGVPFIFATGYGDTMMIPPEFAGVPVVRKPYAAEALVRAMAEALAAG